MRRAAHEIENLRGNFLLAPLIVFERELGKQALAVVGGGLHRYHTGRVLCGGRVQEGAVEPQVEHLREQGLQKLALAWFQNVVIFFLLDGLFSSSRHKRQELLLDYRLAPHADEMVMDHDAQITELLSRELNTLYELSSFINTIEVKHELTWQDIELIATIGMDFMNSEDSDDLDDEA